MKAWSLDSCEENVVTESDLSFFFSLSEEKKKPFEYVMLDVHQWLQVNLDLKIKLCCNQTIYTLQHTTSIWALKLTPPSHDCLRKGFQMPGTKLTASGEEVEDALLHPPLSWVALGVWRTSGLTQQIWNLFGVQSLHCLWAVCWFPTASLHAPNFSYAFGISYKAASCLSFSTRRKLLLS